MPYGKRRSTRKSSSRAYKSRRKSYVRRAPARRIARKRSSAPQTIRIVIEQPQPSAFPPPGATLPDQVGNILAVTPLKKARF